MEQIVAEALASVGIISVLTNLITQLLKKVIPWETFPTNLLALLVAMALAIVDGFLIYDAFTLPAVIGTLFMGVFAAYAAMVGYDKLMEIFK